MATTNKQDKDAFDAIRRVDELPASKSTAPDKVDELPASKPITPDVEQGLSTETSEKKKKTEEETVNQAQQLERVHEEEIQDQQIVQAAKATDLQEKRAELIAEEEAKKEQTHLQEQQGEVEQKKEHTLKQEETKHLSEEEEKAKQQKEEESKRQKERAETEKKEGKARRKQEKEAKQKQKEEEKEKEKEKEKEVKLKQKEAKQKQKEEKATQRKQERETTFEKRKGEINEVNKAATDSGNTKDHYKVLGLESNATPDQIRKAYKENSLLVHPDKLEKADKADTSKYSEREQLFKQVGESYEVLSDEEERRKYDDIREGEQERKQQSTSPSQGQDPTYRQSQDQGATATTTPTQPQGESSTNIPPQTPQQARGSQPQTVTQPQSQRDTFHGDTSGTAHPSPETHTTLSTKKDEERSSTAMILSNPAIKTAPQPSANPLEDDKEEKDTLSEPDKKKNKPEEKEKYQNFHKTSYNLDEAIQIFLDKIDGKKTKLRKKIEGGIKDLFSRKPDLKEEVDNAKSDKEAEQILKDDNDPKFKETLKEVQQETDDLKQDTKDIRDKHGDELAADNRSPSGSIEYHPKGKEPNSVKLEEGEKKVEKMGEETSSTAMTTYREKQAETPTPSTTPASSQPKGITDQTPSTSTSTPGVSLSPSSST